MAGEVVIYWRPGCPFCWRLRRALRRRRLPTREVNIWTDPEAAAVVRSIADGNETVPTVVVGDIAMVNPRPSEVIAAVRSRAPELLDRAAASARWRIAFRRPSR
ncbi:glutaredoxin family protein [Mycobacterium kansasii]|uniref:Glutaredoxin family protein n=3 Tax=Mycobacterium kansasii TaxID=1768 RepID=A0A1V3WIY1_MYCKA|nr:glutaredoxin domain-containing protein [Mycobacterium kansasii]EUA02990.1 glutaredoxin family protein [Mycobacterium kansasii 824]AGZ52079.1 glutaredoxin [Mycobacterium kansasii ATCC 12478]ARG56229.1 NrdH-redoxin [Mycobacterium kansasii]ARG61675.1 NrdH-redoxin [Mycobacterium kansasii]ARG69362.1 NrdH-redoxin [Mycobacterium kansasii]